MKTLQEINEEYAKSLGFDNWSGLEDTQTKNSVSRHWSKTAKIFALEVAKETLKNIADKSEEMHYYINEPWEDIPGSPMHRKRRTCYAVPKQTILDENNIPKI